MHRWMLLALLAGCLASAPAGARTWVYHPEPGLVVPGAVEFALRAAGGGVGRGWPVTLEGQVRTGIPARVELIDVTGRVVQRREVPGAFTASVAPLRASAGIYFARLIQGDRSSVLKLVRF